MALIISLRRNLDLQDAPNAFAAGDTPHRPARHQAEVILFPGVRYERWQEQADCDRGELDRDVTRSNSRRDWLEI